MHHVLSIDDVSRIEIERVIDVAEQFRSTPRHILRARLQGAVVAMLFYEPSTRTRLSFEAAVARLGGNVVGAENARDNSSAKKGETLADVFRVVGVYADAIVIRHHEDDEMAQAASYSPVPIINAGAGSGEHPTQSILDVYTLWREFGSVDGLHICLVGDLKYGRTVHSLLKVLTRFRDIHVTVVHPDSLPLPPTLVDEVQQRGITIERRGDLASALRDSDAIYQTRIQTERFATPDEAKSASDYRITAPHLQVLRENARILHPLPRVDEIAAEVDEDARAAYFRQAQNGLFARMALMDVILGGVLR